MGSKPNRCPIRIRWTNLFVILTLAIVAVIFVYLYGIRLPKTSDPFKSILFVFKSSSNEQTHQLLHVAESRGLDATSLSYDNDFHEVDHLWFRTNCLRGETHNIGIGNISIVIDAWKATYNGRCRDLFETFKDVFLICTRPGPLVIPDTFALKVLRWLGDRKELLEEARLQQITSVDNLYTQESTVFNPLRGKRPGVDGGATEETNKYVEDLVKNTAQDCDFCNYKTMTAEDPFGRVESQYSVAVSNTFKVERFHGLVIWKHHNPLDVKEHELLDAMQTAQRWFWQAHLWDKTYTVPHIYWDILPKASASQIHPHFHVTLARDQYYSRWNRLHAAAVQYALAHKGSNYFTALFKIHLALGLAIQFGNASVMAYLTPSASHEIVLISKVPCKDLFRLLYFCLAAFRDDMGLYAISAGMVFPKLVPSSNKNDLPALIRLVYRGPAEAMRGDIDSLQLFGTVNVNVDPYMVINKIKESIVRRSVDVDK